MKPIFTLNELINALSQSSKDNYKTIFKNLVLDKNVLDEYLNWSTKKYVRNGIYKSDNFELILLCWEAGQETPIHCHSGEECWMYLIEGEIEEVQYQKHKNGDVEAKGIRKIANQQQAYINDAIGLHKLKNNSKGRTISLHLYAKPIESCSYFDEQSKTFIKKNLSYDTYKGEILSSKRVSSI